MWVYLQQQNLLFPANLCFFLMLLLCIRMLAAVTSVPGERTHFVALDQALLWQQLR